MRFYYNPFPLLLLVEKFSAVLSGKRPNIHNIISCIHSIFIVLNNN